MSAASGSHPGAANATSPPSKRDLRSWWKGFKLPSKHQESQDTRSPGIFGVPLRQSITYANVAISLIDENGQSYIYGYVPIVVAKCGVYLKEKATGIEGIFRLSGSEKRIKELKTIFDSPDRYGKGLDWDGYTVHDAANVLRRYLNDLPEPVVPLDLYEKFREPLKGATKQAVGDAEGPQLIDNFDEQGAIIKYQQLITELPPLNRQLLLYILDLLAVFAAKSDENRMNSQNLAAIFQPGMLSHPDHAMAPEEYRLNQCVIIFLIENQDHFLIGMQGTATDEKTKQEIEKGTPSISGPTTPTPNRRSTLGRSASNASAGADSVRRDGKLRRHQSTSSRHSRHDGAVTPNSPGLVATPSSGLGRSNTVPSKKSPHLPAGRFRKDNISPLTSPTGPALTEHITPATPNEQPSPSRSTAPSSLAPPVGAATLAPGSSIFQRSPSGETERRQPNKLKKKRIPGSVNPSAASSTTSLQGAHSAAPSPSVEASNPMDNAPFTIPENSPPPAPAPVAAEAQAAELTARGSHAPHHTSHYPETNLKANKSPPASLHSSFNEGSDMDQLDEPVSISTAEAADSIKEKKRRWRLSRSRKDESGPSPPGVTSPRLGLGSNDRAERSATSIGSSSNRPRKSFTAEGTDVSSGPEVFSLDSLNQERDAQDSGRDEPKGPIGWIRNKYREAKENAEQRRNKSPPADTRQPGGLSAAILPSRGKSLDIRREEPRSTPSQSVPQAPQQPATTLQSTTQSQPQPVAQQATLPQSTSQHTAPQQAAPQPPITQQPPSAPSQPPVDQQQLTPAQQPAQQPVQPPAEQPTEPAQPPPQPQPQPQPPVQQQPSPSTAPFPVTLPTTVEEPEESTK
ncbi:Rho-GTPase-activating protein 5 like [Verticillium longisporum]|uniref:Rho-GTPase-activating protein 5 like n=1 Tax=Verticillium longisporum TaxID=100787 RepID=A0A8I2ZER0_VERLO|nr:Rho-GTPase-activating protein 5 like [Verticillium longisporum]